MDYGKSGAVQIGKETPRFKENKAKPGKASAPKAERLSKEEMIERMKAAAAAAAKAADPKP
jgi:hypothetical protein